MRANGEQGTTLPSFTAAVAYRNRYRDNLDLTLRSQLGALEQTNGEIPYAEFAEAKVSTPSFGARHETATDA
jgi:hypothetical protein